MGKSYIRKRYEYMAVTTPAAMGGMFFLSTAGYIYGFNSPQAIIAMPMIGGGLSLFGWVLYELQSLFNIKSARKFDNVQPFFISDDEISDDGYDFIFRGRGIKTEIALQKLEKFCKIGVKRQDNFYLQNNTLYYPHYKKLSKNTVWSERVFLNRTFLSEEVWTCKYILWKTGQFIEWNPGNQGKAGLSINTNAHKLANCAQRRWK